MNKKARKKLEEEIINAVEVIFSKHNKSVVAKTKKVIRASGKHLAKKFVKALKNAEAAKKKIAAAKPRATKKVGRKRAVSARRK